MRRWAASLIGIIGMGVCALAEQRSGAAPISPSEANDHQGETVTVCGHPAGFVCSVDGTVFNFLGANGSVFRVYIPKVNRRQFGPRLEDRFGQRNVCAVGTVELSGLSSQIVVTTLEQFVLEPGQAPPGTVFGPAAYRPDCDPGVIAPKLKKSVPPKYTAEALAAGIDGKVGLRAIVGLNGRVGDVIVIRSVERGLDEEAVRAAKQFEFEPGTLDGVPVPVIVAFEIEFSIKSR